MVLFFNLARLWPERFSEDDRKGFLTYDAQWMEQHTGNHYIPRIYEFGGTGSGSTLLHYETPWTPNILLLRRLAELSGWKINLYYADEHVEGAADIYGTTCVEKEWERPTHCSSCERVCPEEELDDWWGACPECYQKRGG